MARHKKGRKKRSKGGTWAKPNYGFNLHHRLPSSRGGTSIQSNLSRVPVQMHEAFNLLFGGNPTAHEVAEVLSNVWIDYKYVIEVKLRGQDENSDTDDVQDEDAAPTKRPSLSW